MENIMRKILFAAMLLAPIAAHAQSANDKLEGFMLPVMLANYCHSLSTEEAMDAVEKAALAYDVDKSTIGTDLKQDMFPQMISAVFSDPNICTHYDRKVGIDLIKEAQSIEDNGGN
jgi:hypothetical protein